MNWLFEEIKRAYVQLCRWQTWLNIALLCGFGALAFLITTFAFRTDSVLIYLHRTAAACREMNNGSIIFLFCGMIFFALAAVATLGEVQRYIEFRQYAAEHEARAALRGSLIWGGVAVGIAAAALGFFVKYCS